MPTPVFPSGFRDVDGILWGSKWDFVNLTYSFPTDVNDWAYAAGIFEFEPFNAAQKAAATRALKNIDDVSGLNFTLTTTPGAGNIRWGEATTLNYLDGGALGTHAPGFNFQNPSAEANPPDPAFQPYTQGDVWFSKFNYNAPQIGAFAYAAGILHELGHAVGLKHGHATQDNNGRTYPTLPPDHDSQEYSIMTYNMYPGRTVANNLNLDYPTTLMQDDIAALQFMYGANFAHNSGNTSYHWSPATGETFINNVGQGRPFHNKVFLTIWDGGGIDTFNFANYNSVVKVNLSPGQWSTPNNAQRAFLGDGQFARGSIATSLLPGGDLRAVIENAIGGANHDVIFGNAIKNLLIGNTGNDFLSGQAGNDVIQGGNGNDTIVGGLGNDILTGGAGSDFFLFNAALSSAANRDHITDFSTAQDTIRLENAVFTALTGAANTTLSANQFWRAGAAHDADDRIIYNPTSGLLTYDVNGSGAGGIFQIAFLPKNLVVSHLDFVIV